MHAQGIIKAGRLKKALKWMDRNQRVIEARMYGPVDEQADYVLAQTTKVPESKRLVATPEPKPKPCLSRAVMLKTLSALTVEQRRDLYQTYLNDYAILPVDVQAFDPEWDAKYLLIEMIECTHEQEVAAFMAQQSRE